MNQSETQAAVLHHEYMYNVFCKELECYPLDYHDHTTIKLNKMAAGIPVLAWGQDFNIYYPVTCYIMFSCMGYN